MSRQLYMLDTDTCSFAMRLQPGVLRRLEAATSSGTVVISAIVYSELLDGTLGPKAAPKHGAQLTDLVDRLGGIIAWDQTAADCAAQTRLALRQAGTPIGANDSAIAGHALALDATLVTHNTREFSRVPGLKVEDWTVPAA